MCDFLRPFITIGSGGMSSALHAARSRTLFTAALSSACEEAKRDNNTGGSRHTLFDCCLALKAAVTSGCVVLLLVLAITTIVMPARADENPAEKILKTAPNGQPFTDCLNLTDHLVDLDPKMDFTDMARKLAQRIGPTVGVQERRAMLALQIAAEYKSRSILQLGIIDVFAPLFLVADRTREECRRSGCTAYVIEAAFWDVDRGYVPVPSQFIATLRAVDKKAIIRLSTDLPFGEEVEEDVPYPTFFEGDEGGVAISFATDNEVISFRNYRLKFECFTDDDEWKTDRPGGVYEKCNALRQLYERQFGGDIGYEGPLFRRRIGVSVGVNRTISDLEDREAICK